MIFKSKRQRSTEGPRKQRAITNSTSHIPQAWDRIESPPDPSRFVGAMAFGDMIDTRAPHPVDPYPPGDTESFPPSRNPRLGTPNVEGLESMAEPGTHEVHVPVPTAGGYYAVTPTRGSVQRDFMRPRLNVELNRDLHRPYAPGWHMAPVPARNLRQGGAGPKGTRMKPPPIFGDRVTSWPRTQPRWMTFGG